MSHPVSEFVRVRWVCAICGRVAVPTGDVDRFGDLVRACPAHPDAELQVEVVHDDA